MTTHPYTATPRLTRRILALHEAGVTYRRIADILNAEGAHLLAGTRFTKATVRALADRAAEARFEAAQRQQRLARRDEARR